MYKEFAQYWVDSLRSYQARGVSPTWISIQVRRKARPTIIFQRTIYDIHQLT